MDDQTRVLLRGVLGFLDKQEETLILSLNVSMALRKTMRELDPEFEKVYTKHYQAESQSEGKKASDVFREVLAGLIQQLNTGGGDEN
jgi:hypothetical protein